MSATLERGLAAIDGRLGAEASGPVWEWDLVCEKAEGGGREGGGWEVRFSGVFEAEDVVEGGARDDDEMAEGGGKDGRVVTVCRDDDTVDDATVDG